MAGELVSITLLGASEVETELIVYGGETVVKAGEVTRHFGTLLLEKVKDNAHSAEHEVGAPHIGGYSGEGPNKASGVYIDSWKLEVEYGGVVGPEAHVGTDAAQARRLEFGFHGADSLGRVYNQPPLPHAFPALDAIDEDYQAGLYAIL